MGAGGGGVNELGAQRKKLLSTQTGMVFPLFISFLANLVKVFSVG